MSSNKLLKPNYLGFLPQESDGNAKLKSEYILIKPKQALNQSLSNEKVLEDSTENNKKQTKKARGQNKNRPRPAKEILTEKLCPSKVNTTGVCAFGEKCKYLHDVNEFMKIKPKDLGSECVAFRRKGICQYSFACRFGSDHTTYSSDTGYNNVVNEELKSQVQQSLSNVLSRELQLSLRKRKVDFSRTNDALKHLTEEIKKRKITQELPASENKCDKSELDAINDAKNTEDNADNNNNNNITCGCLTDQDIIPLRIEEKRKIDFSNKLYLAPLTTCGNLPFRVTCKRFGADVTCGEMALVTSLLQGNTSEWALIKRHPCEDIFGVQVCGAFPDTMGRCAELLEKNCQVDFIDINMGCPIDLVFKKGSGCALMRRTNKLFDIVRTVNRVTSLPLTCKLRTGIETGKNTAHQLMPMMRDNGVALATLHGRSREARYTRIANWNYIDECARIASPMPVFGNGDVFSHHDYYAALENTAVSGIMIARGALIKPWLFTEIKERRDWDISSCERMDMLKEFVNEGLMHWGSDTRGVEITRRFLLEWCSFLHRYIPIGILEQIPQRINERPPYYVGRNDLETLMASPNSNDWVKLSEMLLGPVPDSFVFLPKHKANAYK